MGDNINEVSLNLSEFDSSNTFNNYDIVQIKNEACRKEHTRSFMPQLNEENEIYYQIKNLAVEKETNCYIGALLSAICDEIIDRKKEDNKLKNIDKHDKLAIEKLSKNLINDLSGILEKNLFYCLCYELGTVKNES